MCARVESKASLPPAPDPIPDGVSLGSLMNMDAWGHG